MDRVPIHKHGGGTASEILHQDQIPSFVEWLPWRRREPDKERSVQEEVIAFLYQCLREPKTVPLGIERIRQRTQKGRKKGVTQEALLGS